MTRWRYIEPGDNNTVVGHEYSEDEIIRLYFPYWCEQMVKAGKGQDISRQACIEDWVVVNWAERI